MTLQIVRDWVLRFNALGPEGLVDRKVPGQPPLLNEEQRAALARVVEDGPTPAIHGVVRWRIIDLCQWLFEEFRICASETTVNRELLKMGYQSSRPGPAIMRSARPRSRILKKFSRRLEEIAREKGVDAREIKSRFSSEARVRQKNKITRRWAKRGSRPSAPKDQRTASTYIFGAISPKDGKGAALVLPKCDTQRWTCISRKSNTLRPASHAVLILDQAGWHTTEKLNIPENITLLLLPSKCPEPSPTEKVWQFLRDNWLSNRVFKFYDDSSIIAATPGTGSSSNPGVSCPSACATGLIGFSQRGLA